MQLSAQGASPSTGLVHGLAHTYICLMVQAWVGMRSQIMILRTIFNRNTVSGQASNRPRPRFHRILQGADQAGAICEGHPQLTQLRSPLAEQRSTEQGREGTRVRDGACCNDNVSNCIDKCCTKICNSLLPPCLHQHEQIVRVKPTLIDRVDTLSIRCPFVVYSLQHMVGAIHNRIK
jgi:hypothetical protein